MNLDLGLLRRGLDVAVDHHGPAAQLGHGGAEDAVHGLEGAHPDREELPGLELLREDFRLAGLEHVDDQDEEAEEDDDDDDGDGQGRGRDINDRPST